MTCTTCNNPNPQPQPNVSMGSCNNVRVEHARDLDVDNLDFVPEYFFTIRTVIDPQTGNVLYTPTLLPGARVLPSGTNANVFTLDANNSEFTILDGQVVPAYVANEGVQNVVLPADNTHPADFLALTIENELLYAQADGVISMLGGHQYIVGQNYYRSSKAGEVTTNASETGQLLFKAISNTKLLVKM